MKTLQLKITILFAFCLFAIVAIAQPEPCGPVPIMANNCLDACVICDIDGFTGTNNLQAGGQDLGFIFCSNADDMHYIAFIAGSTSLSIRIDVSNCTAGTFNFRSLDLGFYESLDCQTFTPIADCQQDVGEGQSHVFNTHTDLVIGQHYYLIMDGSAGSICDWTFTVLDGTTAVNPLEESGAILGAPTTCINQLEAYTVDFPVGAAEFEWTINGNSLNINSPTIEREFSSPGIYEICVTSKNACDEAPPTCQQILVENTSFTEINDVFCENAFYFVGGDTISETGTYEFILQNQAGCDSVIIANLEELDTPSLTIDANICDGDTLFIGTSPFTQTGTFQEFLVSGEDCDSIVNLDLFVIICNIMSSDFPSPAICHGTASGQIIFNVDDGTPPFTYSWENLNNTHSGSGDITDLGEMITIDDIPRGTYLITIEDGFGNSDIIISEVSEPSPMSATLVASDYNGVNVTCATGTDGTLSVEAVGGVPPYTYSWSSGQTSTSISNLSPINYAVSITDAVGCELVNDYTLTSPDSLVVDVAFNNASCDGLSTGFVQVEQSSGGVGNYTYSFNGEAFSTNTLFENLSPGIYTVEMTDENGCSTQVAGSLTAPQIPVVDLGENYTVELGDNFIGNPAINNIVIQNLQWTAADSLTCNNCLNPESLPINSSYYFLEVISEDGCSGADSVFVEVIKVRKVYLPNAFSPNSDGENDYFTVFGDIPNVQLVEELLVFDRWGGLVFESKGFEPNVGKLGWDGTAKGEALPTGVYTYMLKIRFLDEEVLQYEGSVSLVR